MPGRLIMNHDSGAASGMRDGENKKRNYEGKLINGTSTVNGAPPQSAGGAVSAPSGHAPETYSELPPEIAHISEDMLHPLSTLLLRISQETYNELFETLHSMAEIPVGPQTNGIMTNGIGGGQDNTEANRRKKLLLLKFAQDNRAKFIKLLVLTEWGKKASKDVSQLIDLLQWAREQTAHIEFVDVQIERIKQYSSYAAERNPDIKTALEILSTGKVGSMNTLADYIPPEPISAEQALKLLRYMNTSLSIRLNVHETLPRRLQNWRIGSGRATFVIENQLEFDVVSFTEDASQQWWFLDVRLLFSPAPAIVTNSRFYNSIKFQADNILGQEESKGGLTGLFDWFCNWVLTHKINILRSQAMKLVGSVWTGSLKVENVHRELVVSYWTNRPGKKNWIEIGVSVNKPKYGKTSWRGPPLPSLTVRWFRQGVEVKGVDFGFDWHKLSFERLIKRVIAYHVNDILRTTKENINSQISAHATLSDSEPADSKLEVTLGTGSNSASLCLEPVTGNYIVQPASSWSARAEAAFNAGRPAERMAYVMTDLLAQRLRESVQKYAMQLGWTPVTRSLHLDVVKRATERNVLTYSMYSPRGWSAGWVLANMVDALGSSWWMLEVAVKGSTIDHAEEIKMERPNGSILEVDRNTLASLARVAVQAISFRVTTRQLEKEKKVYVSRVAFDEGRTVTVPAHMTRGWALSMSSEDLLATAPGQEPWLKSHIAVTFHGLRREGGLLWHIATGQMEGSAAEEMYRLMSASPETQKFFKFSADGKFRILLSTPFGKDILGELCARLRDVNRLRSFTTTLQKRKMRLVSSSLQRVEFQYGSNHDNAAVKFSSGREVIVEVMHANPHHRILKFLSELANERVPTLARGLNYKGDINGLDRLCTTLIFTRPLVKALNELEAATTTNANLRNPAIFAHSLFEYRLTYENPVCTFDIRVKTKNDKVYWLLEDNFLKHPPDLRPSPERGATHRRLETLQAALATLFSDTGKGWWGTRKGFFVEIGSIGDALKQLNDTVLKHKMEGGYRAPPPLPVQAPAPAQVQQQLQPQINGQGQQKPPNYNTARAQQHAQVQAHARQQAQHQAQQQAQRRQSQNQNQNQNQMRQVPNGNGRPQQGQGQNRPRPSQQQQDVIEID